MLFSESIVYRLVSPIRIFKDVPQRLVRNFKDVAPGTMAMLTLQPADDDQHTDMIHVAWRTANDHRVDVITIDDANRHFADPHSASA